MSNVDGMTEIKDSLENLISEGRGRFSIYKTEPYEFFPNGAICFEIISDEQIIQFHKPSFMAVFWNTRGCHLLVIILCFAAYGLLRFIGDIKAIL